MFKIDLYFSYFSQYTNKNTKSHYKPINFAFGFAKSVIIKVKLRESKKFITIYTLQCHTL